MNSINTTTIHLENTHYKKYNKDVIYYYEAMYGLNLFFLLEWGFDEADQHIREEYYKELPESAITKAKAIITRGYLDQNSARFCVLVVPELEYIEDIGSMTHEILHIVFFILGESGIKLTPDSEEAYTYYTEHLMNIYFKNVLKIYKENKKKKKIVDK